MLALPGRLVNRLHQLEQHALELCDLVVALNQNGQPCGRTLERLANGPDRDVLVQAARHAGGAACAAVPSSAFPGAASDLKPRVSQARSRSRRSAGRSPWSSGSASWKRPPCRC